MPGNRALPVPPGLARGRLMIRVLHVINETSKGDWAMPEKDYPGNRSSPRSEVRGPAASGAQPGQAAPGHWHGAYTTWEDGGILAGSDTAGPFGTEADARRGLAGQVAAEQGDLRVVAQGGHRISLAEAWLLIPSPAVFTLPGESSRTFSTFPCDGDCGASREEHLAALPGLIDRNRAPVRDTPPPQRNHALPPIFNEVRRGPSLP